VARIVLSGASGLIGKRLATGLTADGHRVLRLVRRASSGDNEISWDPAAGRLDAAKLASADAVIHLSGEPIAGGRWSESRKKEIADSRLVSTRLLAETIARGERKPVFLCASAIGYYGDRGSEWLEEMSPRGSGFLAEVCARWERACDPAREGTRVVNLRLGVVLDRDEGMLAVLALPYKLGLGGRIGAGTQYASWITSHDVVAAVRHVLVSPALVGPVNLVAPAPVQNAEFSATLARVLRRPALLPVPAGLLRFALGEAADEVLLASQRVRPAKLVATGFRFGDAQLEPALRRLFE